MIACDTNIYVYALDTGDSRRQKKAVGLLKSLNPTGTVLLWQVACEFGAVMARIRQKRKLPETIFDEVKALRGQFTLIRPSPDILDHAFDIHARDQVSYWDSLLLAACVEAGVTRLYTQDRQSAPTIRGVEIVNPFR